MKTFKLADKEEFTEVIEMGDIRISAYLQNGKTVLIINALRGGDFIGVQPMSANQIIVKADKKLI